MRNPEKAKEWLQRAKSNMARAKWGKVSPDILYEDLCYDAHQAAEKALKSLCILHEIVFPKTHDIAYLIELLQKKNVEIPEGGTEGESVDSLCRGDPLSGRLCAGE